MISRFFPFLTAVVAIAIFLGYINPTYTGSVATLQAEVSDYERALGAAEQFKQRQAELLAERNAIPPEGLSRLESFLPDGVDNVQLILDLNSLASRSGLRISNFAITDSSGSAQGTSGSLSTLPLVAGTSSIDSITMSLSATGTYGAFRTFLAGAEQSLRPLDLVHLSLTDSDTGTYTYQMTFRIYWLR